MNEELATLDPLARLLFAGLWTIADREGRLHDIPKRIKVQTLPYDECDCNALLQSLHDAKFICRYERDNIQIIQIVNWEKHQRPHPKEATFDLPAVKRSGSSAPKSGKAGSKNEAIGTGEIGTGEIGIGDQEAPEPDELPPACPPPPPSLATPLGREALQKWAAYKRGRREAYKDSTGWSALINKFAPLGDVALAAAVEQSIRNSWAGIFPVKGSGATGPPSNSSAAERRHERHMQAMKQVLEEHDTTRNDAAIAPIPGLLADFRNRS